MYRFDRVDSPTMPRDDVPSTPALSSTAQSPQSSALPSATPSTVDGPVNSAPTAKELASPPEGIEIGENIA
jgi:mRNA-binding protein PUF3